MPRGALTPAERLTEAAVKAQTLAPFTADPVAAKLLAHVFERVAFCVRIDPDLIHRVGNEQVLALADHLLAVVPDAAATPEPDPPVATPCPEGFHWIGQPFTSCDGCGLPAWGHEGIAVTSVALSSPYDAAPWVLKPWGPGEREACRAKWDKHAEEMSR